MKKILFISSLFLLLCSCGNNTSEDISSSLISSNSDIISESTIDSISEDISIDSTSEIESSKTSDETSVLPPLEYGEGIMVKEKDYYDYDGLLYQKNVYKYNSNLDIVLDDCYVYSYESLKLVLSFKDIYEYNENNLITSYEHYSVSGDSELNLINSTKYKYDENNNVIEKIDYSIENTLYPYTKEISEYEDGILTKFSLYYIDSSQTEILNSVATIKIEDGLIILSVHFPDVAGEPMDAQTKISETFIDNVLTSIECQYIDGVEVYKIKSITIYNDNEEIICEESYYYDESSSQYVISTKTTYSFDEANKLIKRETEYYENLITYLEIVNYEYDEENRLIKETTFITDYDDGNTPYTIVNYIY